ncbi:sugar ABC transporter permease [Streptomyces sp. CBMA152]|uniref:sugar ABC transporter permease n=1 Tax=Streptomyces sp. CBMA152 TaxID=1896312 RepID=UPI0016614EC2|nr:sugar ABC transporter permease [Streptomyces sp. CBMA152]MBD0745046.1 sugar ABC transporter permease [Streptomyces sp. CBMA152]
MSAPGWALPALDALLDRVTATEAQVGERFPLYADPGTGTWTTTGRGSWTGGFWAGLLWLRARRTGAARDRAAAQACTARLARWVDADTATRGLILWYGTALADDEGSAALQRRAARACLDAFDPERGMVPWGAAFGGPRLAVRTDGVPGMVPLLATVDKAAAESHLRRHLKLCPPLRWSRGRAWLLLGIAEGARHLEIAELPPAVDQLTTSRLVPSADDEHPDGPLDTSAAAITALALLQLGRTQHAVDILDELVRVHLTADGRLLDGCYDLDEGTAVRHELIWGTFFLAYALATLTSG